MALSPPGPQSPPGPALPSLTLSWKGSLPLSRPSTGSQGRAARLHESRNTQDVCSKYSSSTSHVPTFNSHNNPEGDISLLFQMSKKKSRQEIFKSFLGFIDGRRQGQVAWLRRPLRWGSASWFCGHRQNAAQCSGVQGAVEPRLGLSQDSALCPGHGLTACPLHPLCQSPNSKGSVSENSSSPTALETRVAWRPGRYKV